MIALSTEKQGTFLRASISDVCNFACQYCATDMGMENHTPCELQAPLLSAEEYIRNMRWIAGHGFKILSFTGGEPLLNPQFPQIVKGCRELFETIEITTNGTRLLENIDIIRENIDVLKVSIDAYEPELAVQIARNPLATKTPEIIEECCKAGISTIGLNFVYMKQNESQLPLLVDFASDLKRKYGTDIYISVLDLYFSEANREFWQEQFVDLAKVRERIQKEVGQMNRRLRVGCDSYNFLWKDIRVNMKDSISCTHRAEICEKCQEYCQEGIYSLKHSASGWISVCPSNNPAYGALLDGAVTEEQAHERLDKYVQLLNEIHRVDRTGEEFLRRRGLV